MQAGLLKDTPSPTDIIKIVTITTEGKSIMPVRHKKVHADMSITMTTVRNTLIGHTAAALLKITQGLPAPEAMQAIQPHVHLRRLRARIQGKTLRSVIPEQQSLLQEVRPNLQLRAVLQMRTHQEARPIIQDAIAALRKKLQKTMLQRRKQPVRLHQIATQEQEVHQGLQPEVVIHRQNPHAARLALLQTGVRHKALTAVQEVHQAVLQPEVLRKATVPKAIRAHAQVQATVLPEPIALQAEEQDDNPSVI